MQSLKCWCLCRSRISSCIKNSWLTLELQKYSQGINWNVQLWMWVILSSKYFTSHTFFLFHNLLSFFFLFRITACASYGILLYLTERGKYTRNQREWNLITFGTAEPFKRYNWDVIRARKDCINILPQLKC